MEQKNKEIFINVSSGSTRIAITDNGDLNEIYLERPDHHRKVGNIYRGVIQNVLPGMQAAFINIGTDLNAFLPFSEIGNHENLGSFTTDDEDDNKKSSNKKSDFDPNKDLKIGDEITVQVIKEAYGGKGPRVTTDYSLPGSLLVLVSNANFIGISRKISDKYEKRRLRRIVKEFKPEGYGLILRTIAEGKDQSILQNDFNKLWETWCKMESTLKKKKSPVLLYEDFHTVDQVIRDLFTPDIKKVTVDNKNIYKRLHNYVKEISPSQIDRIQYHRKKGSVFDRYQIEDQINKTLQRRVWLKSGAHLVIEHTEAMVVIDVNSGRFIGKKDHEQNSLKINLEASREIARQLRLRDIGGLAVIDYIDLQEAVNRKKVHNELFEHLKRDRAKVSLSEFSNFGLLEMTRQRIRLSLMHTVKDECNSCNGSGWILSKDTLITKLENWLKRFRAKNNDRRLVIKMNPEVVTYIKEVRKKLINGFMWENLMFITLEADNTISPGEFQIYSKKRKEDVTNVV